MRQPNVKTNPALISLGGLITGGLLELGVALDLQTTDHDSFAAQLTDFIMQNGLYGQAKHERAIRSLAYKNASNECRGFLRITRDVLKPTFGYEYSQAWNALGFNSALVVPASAAKFSPMIQTVRDYFTANPTAEVAPMNVTAARATALFNAFTTAQQALMAQKLVLKTLGNTRNAKGRGFRREIRLLIAELEAVLPSVDPRWERFGLNQPGIKQRPPVPTEFSAVLMGTNGISVKWAAAPRAEYYRLWLKVDGTHTEAIPFATPADLAFLIENLPANTMVEVSLSAVNNGGESARTNVITVVTL